MAMDTVGKHLMENGRHHSFQSWKGPSVRDDSDDEWDDHVRGIGASFRPHLMDGNVGMQGMFENVNAIPPILVPLASEAHGACHAEQQNLGDTTTNWEDAKLVDHVMEAVQQIQTIVENVRAESNSMHEHEKIMVKGTTSAPEDRPRRPAMSNEAMGLENTPANVVHDLNLTYVLLSCQPLFARSSVTKLTSTMLIMTIHRIHEINNKFVNELLYLLHKYILPQPNSLPSNMYHTKVFVEKVDHNHETI